MVQQVPSLTVSVSVVRQTSTRAGQEAKEAVLATRAAGVILKVLQRTHKAGRQGVYALTVIGRTQAFLLHRRNTVTGTSRDIIIIQADI